jgi:cell division protein FtsQ
MSDNTPNHDTGHQDDATMPLGAADDDIVMPRLLGDVEISVTEVSSEVLAELSGLFGVPMQPPSGHELTGDPTAYARTPVGDDSSSDTPSEGSVTNVVVIGDDTDSGPIAPVVPIRIDPIDPLIIEVDANREGDLVVIDADEVDRIVIVDEDRPDPRFEERRRRWERRDRLRRVRWFKLAGVVVAFFVLIFAVLASPLFAIRSVTFEGTVYTAKETMSAARKSLKGASLFTLNTSSARRKLLADPWVADVRITTHFPGSAVVEVSERVPVVWYVGDDSKVRVVDAHGFVIAVLDGWPTKYLQVVGVGPSLAAGQAASDAYRAAAQLVTALPDEIRPNVASLQLSPGGELSFTMKTGTIVRFGEPTDLQNKLVAVVVLLRRQDPKTLAVIDVSTGEPTVQTK